MGGRGRGDRRPMAGGHRAQRWHGTRPRARRAGRDDPQSHRLLAVDPIMAQGPIPD